MRKLILRQRWLMAAVTLIAGIVAAWAARQHIQSRIAQIEAEARMPTVARVVAAFDLEAGTRLEDSYVAVRQMPVEWASSGGLAPEDVAQHVGSTLTHSLRRGDAVLAAHLARDKAPRLSSRVPSGRRAITIPVDDINSLSGMLQAGDLLDLYVSFEHAGKQITAPLLQGVLVLATGAQGADDDGQPASFSTITLDAGPEDAVKLVAARQAGRITAILRHHRDGGTATAAARGDLAGLLGIDSGEPPLLPVVPVLYGDRPGGEPVAAFDEPGEDKLGTGLFEAAVPPEIVSAGRSRLHGQEASRGRAAKNGTAGR